MPADPKTSFSLAEGSPAKKQPDLGEFKRATWGLLNGGQMLALLQVLSGEIGSATRPEQVPLETLGAMGWDPVIYLGEAAASAPVKDPSVYFVEHGDPSVVAETEAWLWRLLPAVLDPIARSLAYGAIPYVLDWTVEDLTITVQKEGAAPRNRNLREHVHYKSVHEIWPGDAEILADNDDVAAIRYNGRDYGPDRAFVAIRDRQFGRWLGQGSRRRAYRAWFDDLMITLWECRWLERSVDPPRIGFAPQGVIKIDGQEFLATQILSDVVMALKNGDAGSLPSTRDEKGNPLWDVKPMDLPDRSEVWRKACTARDAKKLLASLCPPSTVGAEDATFAGARIPGEFFVEFVESNCRFAAAELTKLVEVVHRVNARSGSSSPPEIRARQLPQAKRKLLLEVYKAAAAAEQSLGGGKFVTLAELVSPTILDELGVPRRQTNEAARDKAAPPPGPIGRPSEPTGGRQDRRDSAVTPEGQDANGSPAAGSSSLTINIPGQQQAPAPVVNVTLPAHTTHLSVEAPPPVVVPAPHVSVSAAEAAPVEPPTVIVNVPAPVVNVEAAPTPPPIVVPAPIVNVDVEAPPPVVIPAPVVNVEAASQGATIEIKRDSAGRIKSAEIKEE